jgi:F-type H+-transporting ATPase subunit b
MTLSMLVFPAALSGGEGGGFNPIDFAAGGNLFWTLAIFAASVPFIWIVVMGPVTRALEERDAKAERAIAAAEKASKDAEAARAKLEVTLGEAQASAAKLVAEARAKAESRGHEIVEGAKTEAGLLLDNARKAIRVEQDKAIAAIRNEVVDLSLAAASKVLDRRVDSEADRHFVSQLVGTAQAGTDKIGRG